MAIGTNPFYKRASEHTTVDQDFIFLFSPEVLQLLTIEHFDGKPVIFQSSPGGGKTSLLRIFTPGPLRSVFSGKKQDDLKETFRALSELGAVSSAGPECLGVQLTCASGYADLPPTLSEEMSMATFRALLNCRIIIRALRAALELMGIAQINMLQNLKTDLKEDNSQFRHIPPVSNAYELYEWAAGIERQIFSELDSLGGSTITGSNAHVSLEAVSWLSSVQFTYKGKKKLWKPLLLLDDVHKLQKLQRKLLKDELIVMRSTIPIWLAERRIALEPEELLSQGAREERDYYLIDLDKKWRDPKAKKRFTEFIKSVEQRRLRGDTVVKGSLETYLLDLDGDPDQVENLESVPKKVDINIEEAAGNTGRYSDWIEAVVNTEFETQLDRAIAWQELHIVIMRDLRKKQYTFDLGPLDSEELDNRQSSGLKAASRRLMTKQYGIPYYCGMGMLEHLSTFNVEEFIGLAAHFYDRLSARHTLSMTSQISTADQQRLVKEHAKKKLDSIRRSHTHGEEAQRLLGAIGRFCQERTFEPNAPYAPGVTGIAFTMSELSTLRRKKADAGGEMRRKLCRVIAECVAENLFNINLDVKQGGKEWCVLYLNRLIGANFDLPPQYGGWQPIDTNQLQKWMIAGYQGKKQGQQLI